MSIENNFVKFISSELKLSEVSVTNTLKLFEEGSTIAFIARYRKEMTQSLSEVDIEKIKKKYDYLTELVKRKAFILNAIREQEKLNSTLQSSIETCWDSKNLEDLYLPFKKKKKSKADTAKDKGLEGLAKIILGQHESNINIRAQRFLNKQVKNVDEAIEGACDIIAEWVSENIKTREFIRSVYDKNAILISKVIKSKISEATKYQQYFDYSEPLKKLPSHRLLAILRAVSERYLKVKLEIDQDYVLRRLNEVYIKDYNNDSANYIQKAIIDSCKRLLFPSLENECLKEAKSKADQEAISVFSQNLKQLLLSSPLGSKRIIALDPGFRTGCKLVVLDEHGALLFDSTIYPHAPINKKSEAELIIDSLINKYQIEAIAIGNGTAGKETYQWLRSSKIQNLPELYFVNENGASIYSASLIAREEFPDKDITVRGAVSIGRRLLDPLAELVKIDPKSIGVGQYQHDVNQTNLKESLDLTIQSCVNSVGINLNTSSELLLCHVSGLGPTLATNIVKYRQKIKGFKERKELLKVPRMGPKAYELCAGFLRIKNGKNILDNTAVHPERYSLIKKISRDTNSKISDLISNHEKLKSLDLNKYVTTNIGLPTLRDIVKELEKPGLDHRGKARPVSFSDQINTMDDLALGMILPGVINNLTKFGAFVDIGVKESGLIHISQITDRYIQDPAEVLSLNQEVQVKIIEIDKERKRISLSIKQV